MLSVYQEQVEQHIYHFKHLCALNLFRQSFRDTMHARNNLYNV